MPTARRMAFAKGSLAHQGGGDRAAQKRFSQPLHRLSWAPRTDRAAADVYNQRPPAVSDELKCLVNDPGPGWSCQLIALRNHGCPRSTGLIGKDFETHHSLGDIDQKTDRAGQVEAIRKRLSNNSDRSGLSRATTQNASRRQSDAEDVGFLGRHRVPIEARAHLAGDHGLSATNHLGRWRCP